VLDEEAGSSPGARHFVLSTIKRPPPGFFEGVSESKVSSYDAADSVNSATRGWVFVKEQASSLRRRKSSVRELSDKEHRWTVSVAYTRTTRTERQSAFVIYSRAYPLFFCSRKQSTESVSAV